jgi:hypothetical protein
MQVEGGDDEETETGSGSAVAAEPTGLLIIRAWLEPGSSEPLRARLRLSTDVSSGFDRSVTVTNAKAVAGIVEAWLAKISSDDEPSDGALAPPPRPAPA